MQKKRAVVSRHSTFITASEAAYVANGMKEQKEKFDVC